MSRLDSMWLSLRAGLGDLFLQEHHRPYGILNRFPQEQSSQMITLIGKQTKNLVMRKLWFGRDFQEAVEGEVHLRANVETFSHVSPVLFADCELHASYALPFVDSKRCPNDIVRRPMLWCRKSSQQLNAAELGQIFYAKVLAPLSTVICFFADDLGGLAAVAQILALWLLKVANSPSDLPPTANPRVLILIHWDSITTFNEQSATRQFMLELGRELEGANRSLRSKVIGKMKKSELDKLLASQFGGIRVIALPNSKCTSRSWRPLKSRIETDSYEMQNRRIDARVAFSTKHFKVLFNAVCEHFSSDIVDPFSFIRATRIQYPIPVEFGSHITEFLKKVDDTQLFTFAVPIIASALVFDSYPPGMHSKFELVSLTAVSNTVRISPYFSV